MSSSRKKWNKDKDQEMDNMHRFLAEEGSADSQLYIAIKLLDECRTDPSKAELAVEWLVEAAKSGHKTAALLLENCLKSKLGITDKNKKQVLSCLSRSEDEIRSEAMAKTILTTVCEKANQTLSHSEFRNKVKRIILQTGLSLRESANDGNDSYRITEYVLSYNIKHFLRYTSPLIDLTDDLQHKNLFSVMFNVVQSCFELIDYLLIISLAIMFGLSLLFTYFFFRANSILMYRNLFDANTVRLSLQFLQIFSFARIMTITNRYNNYKLWLKVLRQVDPDLPNDHAKFFKKSVKPILIFIFVFAIELNCNAWEPQSQASSAPTIMSSVVRQMMALYSLLTLIRYNPNLIQLFSAVFHFMSRHYLQELQSYIPYFDYYSSDYSLILCICVVMVTTKSLLNYISLNTVIIPNILIHLMITFTDFTSQPLIPISSLIPLNIHSIFGTILMVILIKTVSDLKELYHFAMIGLIFTDFYVHFTHDLSLSYLPLYLVFLFYLVGRVRQLMASIGVRDVTLLLKIFWTFMAMILVAIPLLYAYQRQSINRFVSMRSYPYDRYHDHCLIDNNDLNANISKQIECIDITLEYKLQGLSRISLVRIHRISNNSKQFSDLVTLGLTQYLSLLSNKYSPESYWKEWRIYEYEVILVMKHGERHVSVLLDHLDRQFVDKLKPNDIYEIEMIYDSIKSSAVLLSAKCKTCWDVFQWNNTFYLG